jgi:hypothetical protein
MSSRNNCEIQVTRDHVFFYDSPSYLFVMLEMLDIHRDGPRHRCGVCGGGRPVLLVTDEVTNELPTHGLARVFLLSSVCKQHMPYGSQIVVRDGCLR